MDKCGATFELANQECVTPCHLDSGHTGDHRGFVLGSPCAWPKGFVSEEECHFNRPSFPDEVEQADAMRDVVSWKPKNLSDQQILELPFAWEELEVLQVS